MTVRRARTVWPVACVVVLGCGGMSGAAPESTTLEIGHRVADGRVADASPLEVSLSVGMRGDLEVFEPERLEGGSATQRADDIDRAIIRSVVSSDEAVVRVLDLAGSHCTVDALAVGTARVAFSTDHGTRTFDVHVAEPAAVEVTHWLWERLHETGRVAFARGGVARFEMVRRDRAGRVLGGYGSAPPVYVDPPRAARLSIREGDVEHLDVHLEMVSEEAALRPLGGQAVELAIVEPAADDVFDLAALDQEAGERALSPVAPGARELVTLVARQTDGTRLLGVLERATLVSTTPETCTIGSMEALYADGVYELARTAEGPCAVEIQFAGGSRALTLPDEPPDADQSGIPVAQR